jgi:hypothetical protein
MDEGPLSRVRRFGVRLFDASTLRASLKTLDVSASGQVVNLRLRVDKAVA